MLGKVEMEAVSNISAVMGNIMDPFAATSAKDHLSSSSVR